MKKSAGLLMYRLSGEALEVLLAHPGGPYFARKNEGSWTIPKGLIDENEPALEAAKREFVEETSLQCSTNEFIDVGEIRQKGGKLVRAWAFEGDCDPSVVRSNTFEMEWPPRSGEMKSFPEIDRAAWFGLSEARKMILAEQRDFLDRLAAAVSK